MIGSPSTDPLVGRSVDDDVVSTDVGASERAGAVDDDGEVVVDTADEDDAADEAVPAVSSSPPQAASTLAATIRGIHRLPIAKRC